MRELIILDDYETAELYENDEVIQKYNDKPSIYVALKNNEEANGVTTYAYTYCYQDTRSGQLLTPTQAKRIYTRKQIKDLCEQWILKKRDIKEFIGFGVEYDTYKNLFVRLDQDMKTFDSELCENESIENMRKYIIMIRIIGAIKHASNSCQTWEAENNQTEMDERILDTSTSLLDEIYDFYIEQGYPEEPFGKDWIPYGLKIVTDFANLHLKSKYL